MADKYLSFGEFLKNYPNDEACLEQICKLRFPNGIFCKNCKAVTIHYRLKSRPSYTCKICRSQTFPLVGTIFEATKVSLVYWFYAIFLMTKTRSGISAKQLQRELDVTYNTAWRMLKQVRMIMGEKPVLSGVVEIDEAYVGGKGYNRGKIWWANWEDRPKQIVMGMVERKGRAIIQHIPNTDKYTLFKQIDENIDKSAHIMSDQLSTYKTLYKEGYKHDMIKHNKHYVDGDIYTNNVENLWSHFKRGIYGVYRKVDKKYLQSYANEFAWRYSHRRQPELFYLLLNRAVNTK